MLLLALHATFMEKLVREIAMRMRPFPIGAHLTTGYEIVMVIRTPVCIRDCPIIGFSGLRLKGLKICKIVWYRAHFSSRSPLTV
jgi:hypothetical protein